MQITVVGIDLGKNVCSLAGLDASGQVVVRRRVRRENLLKIVAQLKPSMVAMEACGGAHHLGRLLRDGGFEVRLMSPEYVRPYVKAQKNDDRDAEAIAEAATRPTMRFVELKSAEQLDMQVLHRARDRLVAERTALINQLRAVLMERGIVIPQGWRKLNHALAPILEGDEPDLSPRVRVLINDMRSEWGELDGRIGAFDKEFAARAREDEGARRLVTIPGIGVLYATALVAAIGKGESFAAWARSCGLAWPRATTAVDRRQATPEGDHQARQCVPAQAADPWRACSHDPALGNQYRARQMVTWPAGAGTCEHRRRGAGEQARTDRLGDIAHGADL
jgi:transposase